MNKDNLGYQEIFLAWSHLSSVVMYKALLYKHNNTYQNFYSNIDFSNSKKTQ